MRRQMHGRPVGVPRRRRGASPSACRGVLNDGGRDGMGGEVSAVRACALERGGGQRRAARQQDSERERAAAQRAAAARSSA